MRVTDGVIVLRVDETNCSILRIILGLSYAGKNTFELQPHLCVTFVLQAHRRANTLSKLLFCGLRTVSGDSENMSYLLCKRGPGYEVTFMHGSDTKCSRR